MWSCRIAVIPASSSKETSCCPQVRQANELDRCNTVLILTAINSTSILYVRRDRLGYGITEKKIEWEKTKGTDQTLVQAAYCSRVRVMMMMRCNQCRDRPGERARSRLDYMTQRVLLHSSVIFRHVQVCSGQTCSQLYNSRVSWE